MKKKSLLKRNMIGLLVGANIMACTPEISISQIDNNVVEQISPAPNQTVSERNIQIALLLDVSGSMDGLIDQARAQLWNIVNELSETTCEGVSPKIQIALYEYGTNYGTDYINKISKFTSDLDDISSELFNLSIKGSSEYCGQVIHNSVKELEWNSSPDDLKMIFIAGNEEFTQGNYPFSKSIKEARKKGIVVNTIFCGDFQLGINSKWKNGAVLGNGSYVSINHNAKTEYINTPYDDQLLALNSQLNSTYITFNIQGTAKIQKQVKEDQNASLYGKGNSVNRAISKSKKHVYYNSSWDLVDALDNKQVKVAELKTEYLPENMKSMNTQERKEYVVKQKVEREKIQQEISTINSKRKTFIATEKSKQSKDASSLDDAMLKAIKTEAQKKNFIFNN